MVQDPAASITRGRLDALTTFFGPAGPAFSGFCSPWRRVTTPPAPGVKAAPAARVAHPRPTWGRWGVRAALAARGGAPLDGRELQLVGSRDVLVFTGQTAPIEVRLVAGADQQPVTALNLEASLLTAEGQPANDVDGSSLRGRRVATNAQGIARFEVIAGGHPHQLPGGVLGGGRQPHPRQRGGGRRGPGRDAGQGDLRSRARPLHLRRLPGGPCRSVPGRCHRL
jgi:hypothetical protein